MFAYINKYGANRFLRLVDLDQSPKMIADPSWQYGFKDLNVDNFPEYLKLDFGKAHYAHLNHQMVARAKKEYHDFPYDPKQNYRFLVDHASKDWRNTLKNLTIPLLILVGDHSPYFDYNFAKEVASWNKLISYKVIKDCGHLIQAEKPQELATIIEKFVN